MELTALTQIIERYKSDPESVYNTWFISSEERMKAFRAIRRGVRDTIDSITAGTFGNDFKGSPLEFVLAAITEQKQVFKGAAHPCLMLNLILPFERFHQNQNIRWDNHS